MTTLITHTQLGHFAFTLREQQAPLTCQYFRQLAHNRMLRDARIFRIVSHTNRRAGDSCPINVLPLGPVEGLEAQRTTIAHESTRISGLTHRKWTVSAARFLPGELYGSFFICMKDEPELDQGGARQADGQGFAAFGQVTEGFDVLQSIFRRAEDDEMLSQQIPVIDVSLKDADGP